MGRYEELDQEIQVLKKNIDVYKNAIGEIEGCMVDEGFMHKAGEVYTPVDEDTVTEKLNNMIAQAERDVGEHTETIEVVKGDLDKLKKTLYAKFGDSINLEK